MKSIILYVLIDWTIICFLWRHTNNQEWKSSRFRSLWERKKKKVEISPSRIECQSETREEVKEGWKLEGRPLVYDLAAWGLWVYTAEAAGWCSPLGRVQIKQRVKQEKMGKANKHGLGCRWANALTSFHTAQVLIYYPYPRIVSHLTLLQRDFVPRSEVKGVDRGFMLFINLLSPILALRLSFHISFFSLRMGLKRYVNPETPHVIFRGSELGLQHMHGVGLLCWYN